MLRLAIFLCLAANSALSQSAPNTKAADCYCTDRNGDRVEMGAVVCLRVDGRSYMARCEMVLNNPFWRKLQDGCLSSRASRLPEADLAKS